MCSQTSGTKPSKNKNADLPGLFSMALEDKPPAMGAATPYRSEDL